MKYKYWIKINGIILKTPDRFTITEYDYSTPNTGRSQDATMHQEIVRMNIGDYTAEWDALTAKEATAIRNAIMPISFSVEIPFLGRTITRTMYVGDRTWTPDFRNEGEVERWNLSLKFSEV